MKWKYIVIYKFDSTEVSPYRAQKDFKARLEAGEIEPFQEFATQDKPKSWFDLIKGK